MISGVLFSRRNNEGTRYVIVGLGPRTIWLPRCSNSRDARYSGSRRALHDRVDGRSRCSSHGGQISFDRGATCGGGDLSFRVPSNGRRDEMGELTELFIHDGAIGPHARP